MIKPFKYIKKENPKTWDDLVSSELSKDIIIRAGLTNSPIDDRIYVEVLSFNLPIEKSALALLKIYQLIRVAYGGNIMPYEWENENQDKFLIVPNDWKNWKTESYLYEGNFIIVSTNKFRSIRPLAFHTKEQAEEFLLYPENVQLIKDFYMI